MFSRGDGHDDDVSSGNISAAVPRFHVPVLVPVTTATSVALFAHSNVHNSGRGDKMNRRARRQITSGLSLSQRCNSGSFTSFFSLFLSLRSFRLPLSTRHPSHSCAPRTHSLRRVTLSTLTVTLQLLCTNYRLLRFLVVGTISCSPALDRKSVV